MKKKGIYIQMRENANVLRVRGEKEKEKGGRDIEIKREGETDTG